MKGLIIHGDNWKIIDTEATHKKPKVVADSPFRYIHYPILECKDINLYSLIDRVTNYSSGQTFYKRTLGSYWGYLSNSSLHSKYKRNPNPQIGTIIVSWKITNDNGILDIGIQLQGPNTHYLEPGFDLDTALDSPLILDDSINLFGFLNSYENSVVTNATNQPQKIVRKPFSLDSLIKSCIIHLYGGDAECSNGVVSINKNNQVSR